MEEKLTRRSFLKMAVTGASAAVLAACQPEPTEAPPPATEAPKPAQRKLPYRPKPRW